MVPKIRHLQSQDNSPSVSKQTPEKEDSKLAPLEVLEELPEQNSIEEEAEHIEDS